MIFYYDSHWRNVNVTEKNDIFNLSVCLIDCHKKSKDTRKLQKNVYCVYQFAFIWCFFHHCSFNSFATTIFARNLVIHWFKRRRYKVANNNYCFSCETQSRIILRTFLYMRATSWDFSLFHTRSLSIDSNKSAHLAVSLEPLPNR